jgi:hypothetical protein
MSTIVCTIQSGSNSKCKQTPFGLKSIVDLEILPAIIGCTTSMDESCCDDQLRYKVVLVGTIVLATAVVGFLLFAILRGTIDDSDGTLVVA